MFDFAWIHIFPQQHENKTYTEICAKQMDICMKNFMSRMSLMFGVFSIGLFKMHYAMIFMGIKTTSVEVKLPFIEENSNNEFALNYLFQTIVFSFGLCVFFVVETSMELCMLVIAISPKLIAFEFRKMDENIEKGQSNPLQVHFTFRNIVQQVMDMD